MDFSDHAARRFLQELDIQDMLRTGGHAQEDHTPTVVAFTGQPVALHGCHEGLRRRSLPGRLIQASGHEVKLISPQFVRSFVQGNKNDFIDALAICEAASRPSTRFVTPKNEAQQTLSVLHRMRESLIVI